jgi:hypothetical protein
MISVCGTVWGRRHGSFLYAIFSDEYAYFGETGDVPAARWGQHLGSAESSFADKLRCVQDEQINSDGNVVFIGLYCEVVDEIEKSRRRIARRAIEEELHRQFLLNKNLFPTPKLLLSTPPPPSVRHRFPFRVEAVAEEAFKLIVVEYKKWIAR